jgi:hypothetical protein
MADIRFVPVSGEIADVSTAEVVWIPVSAGMAGEVKQLKTVLAGAITVADATVTIKKNGTSIGTITVAYDGSAEGDIDTVNINAVYVKEGDYLTVETDGGSTTAAKLGFVIDIKR